MPVVIVFSTLGFAIVVAHTLEVTTLRGRGLFFSSFFLFSPSPSFSLFAVSCRLPWYGGVSGLSLHRSRCETLCEFVGISQKILFGLDVPQTFVACTDLG